MVIKISAEHVAQDMQGLKQQNRSDSVQNNQKNRNTEKVNFSRELQEASRSERPVAGTDPERTEKLQMLKQQIREGEYQPDLVKVAESLINFLSKNK